MIKQLSLNSTCLVCVYVPIPLLFLCHSILIMFNILPVKKQKTGSYTISTVAASSAVLYCTAVTTVPTVPEPQVTFTDATKSFLFL